MLAKVSANGMRSWPMGVLAVVLCAITVAGCGSSGSGGGAASAPGTGSRVSRPAASPSACSPWAGLDDLSNVTTWLRQLIGDEVIFGANTTQAKRDGLAVSVYAQSLGGLWEELPVQYARDLRASVLPVAASPYKQTPEQLNTAANNAQRLTTQISQLCF